MSKICQHKGPHKAWCDTDESRPVVEVISSGPPDRTLSQIMRDPPKLTLVKDTCRVFTVPVPIEVHIDDNGRVCNFVDPEFKTVQIAFNALRNQPTDPRWPVRDRDIEQSILAGKLNEAEITTYINRCGITREDIKRDHFHE